MRLYCTFLLAAAVAIIHTNGLVDGAVEERRLGITNWLRGESSIERDTRKFLKKGGGYAEIVNSNNYPALDEKIRGTHAIIYDLLNTKKVTEELDKIAKHRVGQSYLETHQLYFFGHLTIKDMKVSKFKEEAGLEWTQKYKQYIVNAKRNFAGNPEQIEKLENLIDM